MQFDIKISVYVAGKWTDKDTIAMKMNQIEKLGYDISHKWINYEPTGKYNKSTLADYDLKGVQNCDLLIVVMDDPLYAYRGTFTEVGIALGLGKKIYIFDPNENSYSSTNVFYHHPSIKHFNKWDDIMQMLEDTMFEWNKHY